VRAHDGDWAADPTAAAFALVSLSSVLAAGMEKPGAAKGSSGGGVVLPGTASAALHGVAARAAAAPDGVMAALAVGLDSSPNLLAL